MPNSSAKVSQLINCSASAAFDAFSDPKKITQFWLESTTGPLAKGAHATWHFMVTGASDTVTVDDFEPPSVLAFSWSDGSRTRLEFTDEGGQQTRVSGEFSVADEASIQDVVNTTEGFSIVLCDLKTFLESGRSANLVRAKAELISRSMKQRSSEA